jgi:glycosyltransferase involved in cell wall biosynthesis
MRIGIDARFYGSLGKGLGRYTQKLIENLENISSGNDQYFIFLRKENFDEYQPKNKNFKKILADYQWYSFSEQINMPKILNSYHLDLVHFPHFNIPVFYRKKFILTIHDLILIHFPTIRGTTLNPLWYWIKFIVYKLIIRRAIFSCEKIITVSQFTKKDILKHYEINPEKIAVTYEASDEPQNESFFSQEKILQKYGIIKPYVLYVGNAYPHKNLEALVFGFDARKNKEDLYLVLVGKEDYFYKKLKELVIKKNIKNVIFTGFIPDEDLDAVFFGSIFYIFPSLYEGFGLPPLEAMKRGIPVAASDISCLREILEKSAYYFNAQDKKAITQTIEELSINKKLRDNLREKGYRQSEKYNWEKMAKETLDIYKNKK